MSANGENKTAKSKSKRRKLTPFLCQEMLYDYVVGRLDADRVAAVEEFLKTDQECRAILEGIQAAQTYAEQLKRTEIKSEVVAALKESENAVSLGRKYSSWREWPESLRWSISALAISALVAALVVVTPWQKLRLPGLKDFSQKKASDVVELAEVPHANEKQLETALETAETEPSTEESGSGDEEMDVAAEGQPAPGGKNMAALPLPTSTPTPVPTPIVTAKAPAPTPVASKPVAAADTTASKKEAKTKSFVYRAFMNLADLEEVGPKIAEHITELGGSKAGEVELGWKRGNGHYYHFSLPEENEEKLLEKLRAYGPVRMSKDPHPRVMPPGQVRFILWVEPL